MTLRLQKLRNTCRKERIYIFILCCSSAHATALHMHYLWVKGDGPGHKVYPSHHCNDNVEDQYVNNISWAHDITEAVERCMMFGL